MSTSTRREIVINAVVFVTVIALAGWYLATSVYDWTPWEKSKTVTMRVHNTNLVLTGTGVCVNGVPVGAVHGVTLTPDGAELSLRYPAAQNIPSNATVAIGLQSALGEPYINFVPGPSESPPLPDGAVVDANQISEPESIPGIFRQISLLSQVVSVDPVAGVLNWCGSPSTAPTPLSIRSASAVVWWPRCCCRARRRCAPCSPTRRCTPVIWAGW